MKLLIFDYSRREIERLWILGTSLDFHGFMTRESCRSTKFSIRSNLEIESLAIRRYCRERLSVFIMQFNFRANSLCQPGMLKRNWSFPPSPPPCKSRKRNCYFLSNSFCGTISLDKNCVWGRLLIV